jgi:hypothetical protein
LRKQFVRNNVFNADQASIFVRRIVDDTLANILVQMAAEMMGDYLAVWVTCKNLLIIENIKNNNNRRKCEFRKHVGKLWTAA